MIYDNSELILREFLKFYNDDTYYLIKIFSRKKDSLTSGEEDIFKNIFGSHNERMICTYCVKSREDFEKYFNISKHIVKSIPYTRAYLNVNPKSEIKSLVTLNNEVNKMLTAKLYGDKPKIASWIHGLSYSILSKPEANLNRDLNWVIVDVDLYDERYENIKEETILAYFNFKAELEKANLKQHNINYVEYETPNGLHLLLSYKHAPLFKNPKGELFETYKTLISKESVEEKIDAAILLYCENNKTNTHVG